MFTILCIPFLVFEHFIYSLNVFNCVFYQKTISQLDLNAPIIKGSK